MSGLSVHSYPVFQDWRQTLMNWRATLGSMKLRTHLRDVRISNDRADDDILVLDAGQDLWINTPFSTKFDTNFELKTLDDLLDTAGTDQQILVNQSGTWEAGNQILADLEFGSFSLTGASNGMVADSQGFVTTSRDSTATAQHLGAYNPNGQIFALQTNATDTILNAVAGDLILSANGGISIPSDDLDLATYSGSGASNGVHIDQDGYMWLSNTGTGAYDHIYAANGNGASFYLRSNGSDAYLIAGSGDLYLSSASQIIANTPLEVPSSYLQQGVFHSSGSSRGTIFPSGGGYMQMSNSNTSNYNHISCHNTNGWVGGISTSGNDFKIESIIDSMTVEAADELYLIAATNIRFNCSSFIIDAGSFASDINVGTFSTTGASRGLFIDSLGYMQMSNSTAGTYNHLSFYNTNGLVGRIYTASSSTTYVTSSDYRLKENERNIDEAIHVLEKIKFYEFNFKADPSEKLFGVFAHELQEVIPYAVAGEKDGDEVQGVDYGKLTPIIGAALQNLIKELRANGHIH